MTACSAPVSSGRSRTTSACAAVDDLVDALLLAAEAPRAAGRTYFVTDGRFYAWSEVLEALAAELGVGPARVRVPFGAQLLAAGLAEAAARMTGRPPALTRDIVRAGHDRFWLYDGSRIREETGFRPATPLRESVRRAVEAYRDARAGRPGRRARP